MIDEDRTMKKYGYYSTDLKPVSGKRVVAVCDGCGAIRYLKKCDYRDLCTSCIKIGRKRPPRSDDHRKNISVSTKGKKKTPCTDEHRQHISAGHQGIPYEEWDGFVANGAYCEKFDEACRERIRTKYGHRCFLCGKPQDENLTKNGKQRALSVHHYDMNKDAGCNETEFKLVALCMSCHCITHTPTWTARIEYLLRDNIYDDQ